MNVSVKPHAVTPVAPGDARLLGRTGDLFARSLDARVFSAHAKGPVYDEAEHAFATHWDDADDGGHGAGWQNEYWGKTMLCHAGAIRHTRDAAHAAWCIDKAHRFLDVFQKPNGYLSTYAHEDLLRQHPESDDFEQHWCFNIWGRKYTLWALVELHKATGDARCLAGAEKMGDHLVGQLRRLGVALENTGSWAGISSLSILRPLLELYRLVPKPEYRALANAIVAATDVREGATPAMNVVFDALSGRPVRSWFRKPMLLAKAYELMSYFEGVADYHRLTGDRRALDAAVAFWEHLRAEELNPLRSVGYFDHFLGGRRRVNGMTELCDVVHWIRLSRELWLLTGETKYLDAIEEAFYNAFLAGVSHDGAWGAHIIRSHGTRHLAAPAQTGMTLHQCCPDNMLRAFYDWAETTADIAADGAWDVNVYSDADIALPGARIEIRGNYPVSAEFRLRIVAERDGTLRLRVPAWAPSLVVDGVERTPESGRVSLAVPAGERTFALAFDMTPRLLDSAADGPEDIDSVDDLDTQPPEGYTKRFMAWYTPEMEGLARRTPAATVMRGPLVLAKGRLAGTSRSETLDFQTVNRQPGWRLSTAPARRNAANAAPWGAWTLVLERDAPETGAERREIPVADFWSVSHLDDPDNWFSLWF